MMSNFQKINMISANKNTHFVSKRIFPRTSPNSQRRPSKLSLSQVSTSRSQTSCISRDLPLYKRKMNTFRPKKSLSLLSTPQITNHEEIPAKALEINNLIYKKNRALKIKYNVKDQSDPVPDLLEIRQSVKKEELSFMRRMDKELNTTGNAFLLEHLRQDLHVQVHNYLKETLDQARKNRKNLLNSLKNQNSERYVILPCQLARDNISKK